MQSIDLAWVKALKEKKVSDGSGTQNMGFEFWKCCVEMDVWRVGEGLSSFFFANLLGDIFDDFSKVSQHTSLKSIFRLISVVPDPMM